MNESFGIIYFTKPLYLVKIKIYQERKPYLVRKDREWEL